ncbi:MAG: DNA translocase FtsK 4TM domain-containing protein [Melioribacteraceae bacterium]|nr:DNA translocase FtsK 4TM domain-containing protein [Melioribacteraceae bacterium]
MAAKKISKKTKDNGDNYFVISIEKKKKLIGILLSLFALLIFLSILSYSKYDRANLTFDFKDLFRIFSSDPEFVHRAESTHNWLGIFGAYISNFFIHNTIGFFSLIFPVILFMWGGAVIRGQNYKLSVHLTNFMIITGVIIATFFGVLRFELDVMMDVPQISGKIGDFLGIGLGRLLGGLGSIIFLLTALTVTLIISFDIKFEEIFEFLKTQFADAFSEGESKNSITIKKSELDKPETNLDKIKKLSKKIKPEKAEIEETNELVGEDEIPAKETTIRIVKNDKPGKIIEDIFIPEQANKKEEVVEFDDIIPAIDKDEEAALPEPWEEKIKFDQPNLSLLAIPDEPEDVDIAEDELKRNAELLKEKLSLFDIEIEDISVTPGPVVTLYEIVPAPGVKISRIVSLENDIALALAARGIRIIAPIPGKSAIGVEIPNAKSLLVSAHSILAKIKDVKAELPIALGKTITGDIYITDLASMPHLLIAGSTGSGKSVGINMLITSLIYSKHPSDVKFAIIDPKKIELSFYGKLNKHYLAISPDLDEEIITNPQNALLLLKSVEYEMEKRYDKLAKAGVRNIVDYNKKILDKKKKPADTEKMKHFKLPYIVMIIDELADLMMTAGKEVEAPICRLAQLARAVGIHLVVATQRPSVNVITGTIKANFPARIAYQTATRIDSRTILDMKGAEQLLGRGDMLFLPGGAPKPIRIQNAFISTDEVEKVTNFIYVQEGYKKRYFLPSLVEKNISAAGTDFLADLDPMFADAAKVIVRHQQGSVSLLQRRLKLGYSRAARIVDQLEQAGIVGPSEGSKAREVLVEDDQQLDSILRAL